MKKILPLILCLLCADVCFGQDNPNFFQRLKEIFVVHDTIFIYADSIATDTIQGFDHDDMLEADDDDDDIDIEPDGGIPTPFDTLDTEDRFRKVILFDNGTWLYYNLDMPEIPDSLDTEYWDTEVIHVTGVKLEDLPKEFDLKLVDSVHRFCIPHPGPITSKFKYRKRRPRRRIDRLRRLDGT